MILSEVIVAVLLAVQFNAHSGEAINKGIGVAVIFFICLFVAGFGEHLISVQGLFLENSPAAASILIHLTLVAA